MTTVQLIVEDLRGVFFAKFSLFGIWEYFSVMKTWERSSL